MEGALRAADEQVLGKKAISLFDEIRYLEIRDFAIWNCELKIVAVVQLQKENLG